MDTISNSIVSSINLHLNAPSLLEAIIQNIPAAYYVMDTDWRVVECNQYLAELSNFETVNDVIGLDTADFAEHLNWDDKTTRQINRNNQAVLHQDKTCTFVEYAQFKTGWQDMYSIVLPLYDNNKKAIAIQGLSLNLSEIAKQTLKPTTLASYFKGAHLTPRELDCLGYCMRGYSNKMIAEALNLSPHTVSEYIYNIRLKTGFSSKSKLIHHLTHAIFSHIAL